jgi:prepilin-type N-terminal cleavage/methylation domain-containing protein
MKPPKFRIQNPEFRIRRAFTLTELMIVITIMAILAGLGFSAFTGTMNLARQQRAGSIINRIDQLIGERWEGYRTRAVPIKIPNGTAPRVAAMIRLNALRDLMRMELPDRKSDVLDPPCDCWPDAASGVSFFIYMPPPSLQKSYQRRAMRLTNTANTAALNNVWTVENQGSECLYLILSTMRDGDKSALDYFDSTEIGDTDGDGMPEILDGWGTAIAFIRWPAGYGEQMGADQGWGVAGSDDDGDGNIDNITEANWPNSDDNLVNQTTLVGPVATTQTKNYLRSPDPFDPLKVHAPTATTSGLFAGSTPGFALYPLIVSAGPNRSLDIVTEQNLANGNFRYSAPGANNFPNPYVTVSVVMGSNQNSVTVPIGTPGDLDFDGLAGYTDNISNHSLRSQEE